MSETERHVPAHKLPAGKITAKIYLQWRGQLVSLAQMKSFSGALLKDTNLPDTYADHNAVVNADKEKEKLIKIALKSNASAMAYITFMLTLNERAMSCIEKATTDIRMALHGNWLRDSTRSFSQRADSRCQDSESS